MCVSVRYKSLVGIQTLPVANGENCVLLLGKLCPLRPGAYHVGVTKVSLFTLSLTVKDRPSTNCWSNG